VIYSIMLEETRIDESKADIYEMNAQANNGRQRAAIGDWASASVDVSPRRDRSLH
jgi:hypothetical protein